MAQGTLGKIRFGNDFTGVGIDAAVQTTTGDTLGGGISMFGVNEGSWTYTVDEPGGVLAVTTDTGDNDNECLVAGTFKPADGVFWMEARFKIPTSVATTREAVFVGFTETLSVTTPVMPAERATATTTYNGTGGMVGFLFDGDSTILDWFFVAGDAAAALATQDKNGTTGNANGIRITGSAGLLGGTSITADRWYLVRLEMAPDGICKAFFGDIDSGREMVYVARNTAALGTTDNFHAVCMIENRAAANEEFEVDYFIGEGGRDWLSS